MTFKEDLKQVPKIMKKKEFIMMISTFFFGYLFGGLFTILKDFIDGLISILGIILIILYLLTNR